MSLDYDLLVIGSGPGGYNAAIRASQLGMKVAVVEKNSIGGVCVNLGCIPSKVLINQASILEYSTQLKDLGIKVDYSNFDYEKVYKKSRNAVNTVAKGIQYLFKKNKIDFIKGFAFIKNRNEVIVDTNRITSKYILIASGSSPKGPAEIDGLSFNDFILSSSDLLMLKALPKSIIILGAGPVGVELAYVMSAFGVQVHLVEAMEHILPCEDHEIANVVLRSFKKKNIKISTSTRAKSIIRQGDIVRVRLEDHNGIQEYEANKILIATGRKANIYNMGLEQLGIDINNGFISVGDYYKTSIDNIYAIGDVINTPQLAHLASKEGEVAVEHITGKTNRVINLSEVPSVIYCEPQVASFGYTELKAKNEGLSFKKEKYYYKALPKAVAINESDGFIKLLYSNNKILGVHIVGTYATEIIHELLIIKALGVKLEDTMSIIYAHPTISELIMEITRITKPVI